jgi:hypothetical protein
MPIPKSFIRLVGRMIYGLLVLGAIVLPPCLFAQDSARHVPEFTFGKVQPSDFTISSPAVDSNTDAVILADVGSVALDDRDRNYKRVFTRLRRTKILNTRGFDVATVAIRYSARDNGPGRLQSLKAMAYNLENGKVESRELTDKDIFLDETNGDELEEKFTFPNIKAGSIIEYTYTVRSSYISELYPWDFQGKYPRLWTDFRVSIPDLFNYVFLMQGNFPVFFKSIDSTKQLFGYPGGSVKTLIHTVRWVMKDMPSIQLEPFTSTLDNYVACIRFQMSQRPASTWNRVRVLDTWNFVNDKLVASDYFGGPIGTSNHWMRSDLKKITDGCKNDLEKAEKIYISVRDRYLVGNDGIFMDDPDALKDIYKSKTGSVPEINLLLVAMLREANLQADPVILSTRGNGFTNAVYPILENFNYVILQLQVGNKVLFLDAAQPRLGFGKLPLDYYNGHARVITKNGYAVYLQADSIHESKMTTVFVTNDEKDSMYAACTITPGYYGSLDIREAVANGSQESYFKTINAPNPSGTLLQNTGIDSLHSYDDPVTVHYEMKFSPGEGDFLYINPMFNEGMKENPFKSAKRLYPVEMPYAQDEMYVMNMEVPNGYKIDELPKSARIDLNGGSGRYEYSIQSAGNSIQFVSKLLLKKTLFDPEDYQTLRDFYAYIVKKQGEMIIFKKIK